MRRKMNSAKNVLKNQDNPKVRRKDPGERKTPVFAIIVIAAVVIFLCAGVLYEQLKPQVVLTVNGENISLKDMQYRIWSSEQTGAQMESFYQMYGGGSYWDAASATDSTKTNRQEMKENVLNSEIQCAILYNEAKAAKITLTDKEKTEIEKSANDILDRYSFTGRLELGFSKKYLKKQMERQKLADKFKEAKIEEFGIKEEDVTKDISKEEYRQYDIEYYMASYKKTDENNEEQELSSAEKKELQKKMEALVEKSATAEDFTKLLDDDEQSITYTSGNIIEKDGFTYLSDEQLAEVKKMKNDEISSVIDDTENKCYFVIKMIDNNSEEAYKSACDSAVETEKETQFNTYYEELYATYKVTTNSDVWSTVVMGTVTTGVKEVEKKEETKDEDSSDDKNDSSDEEDTSDEKASGDDNSDEDTKDATESEDASEK